MADWYEEYKGTFPCYNCGAEVSEDDNVKGCCSGRCFGAMVGIPVG